VKYSLSNILTAKMEKFCNELISGKTAKESYISAYNANCTDKTAYTEATRLLQKESIQKRLKELSKPLEAQAIATGISEREKIKTILWNNLEKVQELQDHNLIVKYCDIINRMNSEYVNISKTIEETKTDISNLNTETLKTLAGH